VNLLARQIKLVDWQQLTAKGRKKGHCLIELLASLEVLGSTLASKDAVMHKVSVPLTINSIEIRQTAIALSTVSNATFRRV
jgi:hypothetical protein